MTLYAGFIQLGAGLSVGLAGMAAGFAVGIVGDAGVRASAQQPRLFTGMVSYQGKGPPSLRSFSIVTGQLVSLIRIPRSREYCY